MGTSYLTSGQVGVGQPGAIEGLGYTDNVIDLMTREMASLPLETREAMKMAAVSGILLTLASYHLFPESPR